MAPVELADDDVPTGDRRDADVAARLLLSLTALYAQRSNHTAEEQRQYTELVLGLVDKAGPAACATAAARLQRHPDAPATIVARLGGAPYNDGPHTGPAGASHDPQFEKDPLEFASDEHIGEAPADDDPYHEKSGSPESRRRAPAPRRPLTPEFGEAFFAASPADRRRMLAEIAGAGGVEPASEDGRRFHVRIDNAPWLGRTGAFIRDFEQLIDAPKSVCERILNDPSGEAVVIAARATGMPAAILQRILLLICPATNHSVQRVYELTELYHDLDGRTARDLLAAWRLASDATEPHGPQTAPAEPPNLRARFRALNARIENRPPGRRGAS